MLQKISKIMILMTLTFLSTLALSQADPIADPTAFTRRPTEYSGTYSNPTLAYDGSFTTASTASVVEADGTNGEIETWYGFAGAPSGSSGMQLNVNSSAVTGRGGSAIIYYSLNGGSTFTRVYLVLNGTRMQQTDSISLSNSQDLTKVQVKAQVIASSDGSFISTASQSVYEIWISGND